MQRGRLGRAQRAVVYVVVGMLWATGAAWLLLHEFLQRSGPFGSTPHPLEPAVLTAHGVLAILAMYLLGWVSARHALRWWLRGLRRWSGGTLAGLLMLLVVSGFALFFVSDDAWQRYAAVVHEVFGLGVLLIAIPHWTGRRGG